MKRVESSRCRAGLATKQTLYELLRVAGGVEWSGVERSGAEGRREHSTRVQSRGKAVLAAAGRNRLEVGGRFPRGGSRAAARLLELSASRGAGGARRMRRAASRRIAHSNETTLVFC